MSVEKVNISESEFRRLRIRFRKLNGQISALAESFESESASEGTLQQLSAVRGAITGLMREIIILNVRHSVENPCSNAEKIDEEEAIIAMLKSFLK